MVNTHLEDNEKIIKAKDWLLYSGIQEIDGSEKGGFKAWFDLETGKKSYIYSEITGYGITTLLFLAGLFKGSFVERACLAADWLKERAQHPTGGVMTRYYLEKMKESELYDFDSQNLYAFDNGMVLYSLVNLYKTAGNGKYLDFAKEVSDFLITHTLRDDGFFYAIYDAKKDEKIDIPFKWSTQSGSYHSKLALGFTDMYDVTKEKKYRDISLTLCEKAAKYQDKTGRFITSRADASTHLHPHSYSAEGLVYTGLYFKRDDLVESAERAVKWALSNQKKDGGIPKKFSPGSVVEHYRTDSLAQILRLSVILRSAGRLDGSYDAKMAALRQRLESFQYSGKDRQNGGFYYGYSLDGRKVGHINSWCSMFAVQALVMHESYISGAKVNAGCLV